jgi:pantetheine-phosphate adenylyltransferase
LEIVKQAYALFGSVRILLLINPDKTPLFSVEERKEMISQAVADLPGVSVDSYNGLLVDYMRARNLTVCVRGVRNGADASYELHNAHLSQSLYPVLHTLFLPCPAALKEISSSCVKAACQTGRLPDGLLPASVVKKLAEKFLLS